MMTAPLPLHPDLVAPTLDVEALDATRSRLRAQLTERLTLAVADHRTQRSADKGDLPLGPSDVAPLVRQLARARDVFNDLARMFSDLAGICEAEMAEEALEAGTARLVIGDEAGDITVAPAVKTVRSIDHDALGAAIAAAGTARLREDVAAAGLALALGLPEQDLSAETAAEHSYRRGAASGYAAARATGDKITAIRTLIKDLQAAGLDELAGAAERAVRESKTDAGWKITRTPPEGTR